MYSFPLLPLSPPPPHTHQVYRLQAQVDLALADLDTAIQLSGGRGRVAEQAYTQRGLVRRLRGEDERALEDFKRAARLGGTFAQKHTCEAPVVAFYGEKKILCILSTMHG